MFLLVQGYKNIPLQHCWVILSNLQTSVQESSHFHWFPLIARILLATHRHFLCARSWHGLLKEFFLAKYFLSAPETQNLRGRGGKGLHEISAFSSLPMSLIFPFCYLFHYSHCTWFIQSWTKWLVSQTTEWLRVCVVLSFSCLKSLWGVTPNEWAFYPATCSHSMMYFCLISSYKLTFCYRLTTGTALRSVVWCSILSKHFPTGSNPVWNCNCHEKATNHSEKYLNFPPLVRAMFMNSQSHMTEGTLEPF